GGYFPSETTLNFIVPNPDEFQVAQYDEMKDLVEESETALLRSLRLNVQVYGKEIFYVRNHFVLKETGIQMEKEALRDLALQIQTPADIIDILQGFVAFKEKYSDKLGRLFPTDRSILIEQFVLEAVYRYEKERSSENSFSKRDAFLQSIFSGKDLSKAEREYYNLHYRKAIIEALENLQTPPTERALGVLDLK
ncbi:MAG: hypothetical protein NUV84_03210, partial [Candidatus Uhrbacteria bacterium]|nr:hypothetical protein [Candidatus Uhrbacteria bacterium]